MAKSGGSTLRELMAKFIRLYNDRNFAGCAELSFKPKPDLPGSILETMLAQFYRKNGDIVDYRIVKEQILGTYGFLLLDVQYEELGAPKTIGIHAFKLDRWALDLPGLFLFGFNKPLFSHKEQYRCFQKELAESRMRSEADWDKDLPGGFQIRVLPQFELALAALSVSDIQDKGFLVRREKVTAYEREVNDYFQRYSDHPLIVLLNSLPDQGLVTPLLIYLVNFGEPPEMKRRFYFNFDEIWEAYFYNWIDLLRSFAVQSNFMSFFDDHRSFYEDYIADIRSKTDGQDMIAFLEDYFGAKFDGYYLYLSPLATHVVSGPVFLAKNHRRCSLLGGLHNMSKPYLEYISLIEWAHGFVGPICVQFSDEIKARSEVIMSLQEGTFYGSPYIVLEEYIIVTVGLRYVINTYSEEDRKSVLDSEIDFWEEERGFKQLTSFIDLFAEFEERRDIYPTVKDFFPRIFSYLDRLF